DFAPFLDAARLLYGGPWIAERYAAVGKFMDENPGAVLPLTAHIIGAGKAPTAAAAFAAQYELRALKRAVDTVWSQADYLVTPTAGTIYSIAAIEADPVKLNST